MAEQTFELIPYGVRYQCDACGEGEMKSAGLPDVTMWKPPVRYPHECDGCGAKADLAERYPTVRWRTPEAA
jgi:hypothetical protein